MALKTTLPSSQPPRKAGPQRSRRPGFYGFVTGPVGRVLGALLLLGGLTFIGVFSFYYIRYQKIVDARMRGPIFETSAQIYAAPQVLQVGDTAAVHLLAAELSRSGYTEPGKNGDKHLGTFRLSGNSIEIRPGPESYHNTDGALVTVSGGKVSSIKGLGPTEGQDLEAYELEPQLITAFAGGADRTKRRLVTYDEIPKVLVNAIVAIEDRRFFEHNGVNYLRFIEAPLIDIKQGNRAQGASTLTMQIARGFFLTPEKTIRRKLTEALIATELEQRFSKQQIFAMYANYVPMGQRGSFSVNGMGEASRSYFNKDIKDLTLPEAAMLAGLIQRPSYLSPYRHPDRALDRRNLVLDTMVETGAITRADADKAKATPLQLAPPNAEASDAPYFVDLVRESLLAKYSERDLNQGQYRIYTGLVPELQRAAAEAVEEGIKKVDVEVQKLRTKRVKVGAKTETTVAQGPQAQVALVAIDAHTGEVVALVGGRNYGVSQLNHAVAKRPTGSIFKPFVYAAAVNTAVNSSQAVFTPASMVDDSPTTFSFGDQIYEPRNYKEEYHGLVTARYALAMSLNNATVKLAEEVGYDHVAELAKAAGITSVKPTPAMALGAYDATPVEMAGAYTVFANGGVKINPLLVHSLRDAKGDIVEDFNPQKQPTLDPRVAYVMTNMMENVVNYGLGYTIRREGFTPPAAGKTGTSRDAWFAGYTTNLICIVWVGMDDYSDLRISGAVASAPIWAAFMKKAALSPAYRDMKPFSAPDGVVVVSLDRTTNRLATPTCPDDYSAAFVAGTEPHDTCDQQPGGNILTRLGNLIGIGNNKPVPPPASAPPPAGVARPTSSPPPAPHADPNTAPDDSKKKKGFLGKIFGVFKEDKGEDNKKQQPTSQPPH